MTRMAKPKKGAVKRGPNGEVAIATGPGVALGVWFVFYPDSGGHYTDGISENINEWTDMKES